MPKNSSENGSRIIQSTSSMKTTTWPLICFGTKSAKKSVMRCAGSSRAVFHHFVQPDRRPSLSATYFTTP